MSFLSNGKLNSEIKFQWSKKKTTLLLWQPFHLKVILYKAFKLLLSFFLSHSSIFLLFPLRPAVYSVKSSGVCNLHIISLFFYVPFSIIIWVYMWVCVCSGRFEISRELFLKFPACDLVLPSLNWLRIKQTTTHTADQTSEISQITEL